MERIDEKEEVKGREVGEGERSSEEGGVAGSGVVGGGEGSGCARKPQTPAQQR